MPIHKQPVSSSVEIKIAPPEGFNMEGDTDIKLQGVEEGDEYKETIEDILQRVKKMRVELDALEHLIKSIHQKF